LGNGASPQIVSVGTSYTVDLGGSGVVRYCFNNAIFAAGGAAIPMRLLWVSNIINLVLIPA
jgi:hypothetical protein